MGTKSYNKRNKRRGERGNKRYAKENISKNKKIDFYNSDAWKRLRLSVLKKYGRKCMRCKATWKTVSIHVDHIKPRSLYPELELVFDNMQVLCRSCNLEKGNSNDIDYRDGKNTGSFNEIKVMEYDLQMLYEAHDMMEPTGESI